MINIREFSRTFFHERETICKTTRQLYQEHAIFSEVLCIGIHFRFRFIVHLKYRLRKW